MAQPNSKATLKEYVKRKLGAPVLEINVDDDQFDDRIDEGLQYFREYCYDGSIKCYLKHELTQNQIDSFKTNESHSAALRLVVMLWITKLTKSNRTILPYPNTYYPF